MKIGIFTDSYLPSINGVVNQVHYLKKGLEAKGHEVHLFCPGIPGYTVKEKNVHVYPSIMPMEPFEKLFGMHFDGQVSSPLKHYSGIVEKLDIIHTHHLLFVGNYAARYARKYNKPFIFTNHVNYKDYENAFPVNRNIIHWFCKKMLQNFLKQCDIVVSPAEEIRRQLKLYYKVKGQNMVIYNGVDVERFSKKNASKVEAIKKKHGISKDSFIITYIGRLSKEKNLEFLFKTIAPILKQNKSAVFLVVGDGPTKEKLLKLASTEKLSRQVICTGFISNNTIEHYYQVADVFVTASKAEAFPVTLVESIAAGLPIVALDGVGVNEIVVHGENGYLCKGKSDFEKYLLTIMKDKALHTKLIQGAQKISQKFSIKHCVDQYEALYKKLTT